ncbi:kinesin light chain, partial [Podospora australis]
MVYATFGHQNRGLEVGQSNAPITVQFNPPPERPETPAQPFATIPFARDGDFVDRGDILEQINRLCSEPAARVALVGLGGVGKSQLAIEFAHRIAVEQPSKWVFWVHAGTLARIEEGFITIANTVKLPGRNQPKANIPQLVYGWLSNEQNGKWTMILDSADDGNLFYALASSGACNEHLFAKFLPQSRNGSIIITTRNRYLADRLTGRPKNIIEVGPMTQTDSITLLKNKLGSLSDMTVATNLVQALDLVPLAISQAAAYIRIRAPRSSPEKYLAEFQKGEGQKIRLLQYDGGDLRRDGGASNTILTTWQISFDHIRSKRPSAAKLLSLMSFFDRQGIPERVLKDATRARSLNMAEDGKFGDGGGKPNDRSAIGGDTNINADDIIEECFEDDVAMLREYCLVTTNADGDEFEMHGLVQLSTRIWLKAYGQQETFKQQYIKHMALSFPPGEYQNWGKCQGLFAHVQVALGYRPDENTTERWATLLHNGGWYAWSQGRYDVAEQMADKAREVREKQLGKRDLMTLASTTLFGMILEDRGQWEEAEKLFAQVMETRKTKLGADHPDTLTSMANLASTYRNQGRWEEAEKLDVQVMETSKTKLGADHPDTLTSMANLA